MRLFTALPVAAALAVGSCCPSPDFPELFPSVCEASSSTSSPRILFMDINELTNLEATAKKHAVAVRYEGCELEVLPACHVPGRYEYEPVSVASEEIQIDNEVQLALKLPLSFASLHAEVAKGGKLKIEQREVGLYGLWESRWSRDELKGECAKATHIVTHFPVGAYYAELTTEDSVGGGLDTPLGGTALSKKFQASKSVERSELNRCTPTPEGPPPGCTTPLAVHLVEVVASEAAHLEPDSLIGLWKGIGHSPTQDGGTLTWDVQVRFEHPQAGKCAEVKYSGDLNCEGFWECQAPLQDGVVIDFTESLKNTPGEDNCTLNAPGRLVMKSKDTITLSYYGQVHDRAVANRVTSPAATVPPASSATPSSEAGPGPDEVSAPGSP